MTSGITYYTTGEAARITGYAQQSIIRFVDKGVLEGERIPGSRHRRIPRAGLIKFMRARGLPLGALLHARTRVLVVEDDPAIVEMLVDLLERDGRFAVRAAGTAFQAGRQIARFEPHVLALDYRLPDLNGDEVLRAVRADAAKDELRIVVMSGVADDAERERLLALGADEFLPKPFSLVKLLDCIAAPPVEDAPAADPRPAALAPRCARGA